MTEEAKPISTDPTSPFFGVVSKHIDPAKAAELEAKWRRLEVVQSVPYKQWRDEWLIVLRSPTRTEFKQWQDGVNSPDPRAKVQASNTICAQLIVYPDPATLDQWLEVTPGIFVVASHAVSRLLGLEGEEAGKS